MHTTGKHYVALVNVFKPVVSAVGTVHNHLGEKHSLFIGD